jgi:hypothetical protein
MKNIDFRSIEKLFKQLEKPLTKKKRVLLVRHGQSVGNIQNIFYGSTDYPLTDIGIIEARLLSPLFQKYFNHFDFFASSNLMRAIQTYNECLYLVNENDKQLNQEFKHLYSFPEDYSSEKKAENLINCILKENFVDINFLENPCITNKPFEINNTFLEEANLDKDKNLIKFSKSNFIFLLF